VSNPPHLAGWVQNPDKCSAPSPGSVLPGSGNLPRVGQFENVAIILYKISTAPGLYVTHNLKYTHAWFPREKFDTVVCKGNWIFGAYGNGYIGLWSQNKPYWVTDGEYAYKEIIAENNAQ
jgi:hypothetical protein